MQGRIIRGIAGFYHVETDDGRVWVCRARGGLRREEIRPLPGDMAEFVVTHENDREGSLTAILPRRNALIRPAVANVDQALLFFSVREPDPSLILVDRYLLFISALSLPTILCFNKADLAETDTAETLREIYRLSGLTLLFVSVRTGEGIGALLDELGGKTTFLAGPSGAGKSSLINRVCEAARAETGELSKKLARGKNTTRHSELFRVTGGTGAHPRETWLIDTPGFTALTVPASEECMPADCYAEFIPYRDGCRFSTCRHLDEPECAVRGAAEAGVISPVRYDNYRRLYAEWKQQQERRYR